MAILKQFKQTAEPVVYVCEWDTHESVPPGSHYGPVVRDVYVIECNVSGYGTVTVNDKTFAVAPGDFYVLLPGQRVTFSADTVDPRIALWCTVSGMRIGQALAEAGITVDAPFAPAEKFPELRQIMEKLYTLSRENDMGSRLMQAACIYELLGVLTRGKCNNGDNRFLEQAIGLMESGYHTHLTVADVADEMSFDRCYFSTLFKKQTGVSPHAYLTSLRIEKACVLLRGSDVAISDVAESVGLDPRNFSRLFKKETGMTPNMYKKVPQRGEKSSFSHLDDTP